MRKRGKDRKDGENEAGEAKGRKANRRGEGREGTCEGGEERRFTLLFFPWTPPSRSGVGQGNPTPAHGLVGSALDVQNSLSSQTQ